MASILRENIVVLFFLGNYLLLEAYSFTVRILEQIMSAGKIFVHIFSPNRGFFFKTTTMSAFLGFFF